MALGTLRRSSITSCTRDNFDPASTVDKCLDSLSDKIDDNDLFCEPETTELNPHTQEISSSPVRSSETHYQPSNNKREISKKRRHRKQQIQVTCNIFPVGSNNIINQSRATWLLAFEGDLPTSDDESTLETSSPVLPTMDQQSAPFPVVIQAKQADVAEGESNWQVVGEDLLVTLTEQDITRLIRLFPGAPAFDFEDGRNCAFNGKCGRCDKQLSPTTAFLDSYDARLYCMNCHQLQEAIIPRDVIYNWDFSLQPVSQPTRSFLGELFNRPVINLAKIHPSLYAVIPELLVIRQLRRALILLWHQIARCDAKSASDLQRCIRPLDYMLISLNDLDLYSMHDLCRVQSGELQKKLMTAICDVALVHVHGCRACRRRALLCDLCGDVERPIWPHEFTTYKWLSEWLAAAQESFKPAKAIIAPRRIFILGPSHHVDIGKYCAIPEVSIYQTPLADLEIDRSICDEFAKTGRFVKFSKAQDEAEHSIEMQLPYIAKVMQGPKAVAFPHDTKV
ncbi:hypothetical protein X801_04789 [Opisthorchis viverrini]|uniref:Rubicon Homology domain-containing protein n=1 Tax=Opisthorchis viverrini TaxID=6198 RepID=A0A1S8WY15_OPIVI|nr:hypothetical protein X801_04789 [Opisthorchis viverrini]